MLMLVIAVAIALQLWGLGFSMFGVASVFVAWIIAIYVSDRYRLRRFARIPKVVVGLTRLNFIFVGTNMLFHEVFFGGELNFRLYLTFHTLFYVMLIVARVLQIRLIKRYRSLGNNFRNVLIVGETPDTRNLAHSFADGNEMGFKLVDLIPAHKFTLAKFEEYVKNGVTELFISARSFNEVQFSKIIDFSDNNLVKIRVVPNFSGFFASNLKIDYVGFQPVLVHRDIPLDDVANKAIKRLFDFIFSLFVIVVLLSWLYPLMALLIKLESKGPVLFKQKRSGVNNQDFWCFKFRSMAVNTDANAKQATKGDARITKIGAFIRKTSIDELPQFFNVLFGDMSVVGPRPHMVSHTAEFSSIVDRYMLRHMVKPGITGLAQTMGYRGETRTQQSIRGRVSLDRFYIENWNFFLDLKIIYKTVANAVTGEEEAY